MTRPFDICIRGAGIVGRTLALHLAGKQLRVALVAPAAKTDVQPAEALADDVRAYALNQPSRQLLEAVRCWPDAQHATPVVSMQVHNDDGARVAFDAAQTHSAALNWIVDVPALEARLADAVRFQPLIEVFSEPKPAALTVVCEGKASQSRQEWGVEWDVTPYDQWALAARVQCEQAHAQIARQWFNEGEILAFLPLGGADGNLCALVWSVSPQRAKELQALNEDEFCRALGLASHGVLGEVTLTSARKVWPLQQALARRWSGVSPQGAWVLAGDAAHTVHPLSGQGLNLGLADAACLAGVLAQREYWRALGDEKLLRRYERARKADVAAMGAVTDGLHGLFAQTDDRWQMLRNWGMKGFARSSLLKRWVARQAAGL